MPQKIQHLLLEMHGSASHPFLDMRNGFRSCLCPTSFAEAEHLNQSHEYMTPSHRFPYKAFVQLPWLKNGVPFNKGYFPREIKALYVLQKSLVPQGKMRLFIGNVLNYLQEGCKAS